MIDGLYRKNDRYHDNLIIVGKLGYWVPEDEDIASAIELTTKHGWKFTNIDIEDINFLVPLVLITGEDYEKS